MVWLGLLLCRFGIHDLDEPLEFPRFDEPRGSVLMCQCKRCKMVFRVT